MEIIAIYNIKGGVGKTTTAVNLAYRSAADGWPTLLWDLDPQGAATYIMRREPQIEGGSKHLIRGETDLAEPRGCDRSSCPISCPPIFPIGGWTCTCINARIPRRAS